MTKHRGIGGLITNPDRTLFYLQQKDELYRHHPLGWSFFGGEQDGDETAKEALLREFKEELHADARDLLEDQMRRRRITAVFEGVVSGTSKATQISSEFEFTLFEIVVADPTLLALTKLPSYEGRGGLLVGRDVVSKLDWIWGLEDVFKNYLETRIYLEKC